MTPSTHYRSAISRPFHASRGQLVSRWSADAARAIRHALVEQGQPPDEHPTITVRFLGGFHQLSDLRGLDLSALTLHEADLAYCALDHVNLGRSTLTRVQLQYSRMIGASMRQCRLIDLQASPIDARQVDLTDAMIQDGFFMGSSFDRADFTRARIASDHLGICPGLPAHAPLRRCQRAPSAPSSGGPV